MVDENDSHRVESSHYVAEVLQGNSPEPFWYYILQRKGSSEILDLMKFKDYEDAIKAARQAVARMSRAAAVE